MDNPLHEDLMLEAWNRQVQRDRQQGCEYEECGGLDDDHESSCAVGRYVWLRTWKRKFVDWWCGDR